MIAQNSTNDAGIDIQGWVWQNLQPQYVCTETYNDSTFYSKKGNEEFTRLSQSFNGFIYPNPVLRGTNLNILEINADNVQLYNMHGQLVFSKKPNNIGSTDLYFTIPINLDPGIYLLIVDDHLNQSTFKISVQ